MFTVVVLTVALTRQLAVIRLPQWISLSLETAIDVRVLAYAAGITLLTALFFGLAPARPGWTPTASR